MKYRATILTPTLVGDGQALSPIDYMVWKDHVNVLDQDKIFAMMAKRPVFEGYLTQLRKAEKFDFQNWGGLAQSAALRRIPFESPAYSPIWDRAFARDLFIPTFLNGPSGHYLPGSALRGALRTALVHKAWSEKKPKIFEKWNQQFEQERGFRYAAQAEENLALGQRGNDKLRAVAVSDSKPVPAESFRVYLTRTAKLVKKGDAFGVDWKPAPTFAEMAVPGTLFEGAWKDKPLSRHAVTHDTLSSAANLWAANQLAIQKQYAERSGLPILNQILTELEKRLEAIRGAKRGCLLQIGWGGGFASKAALGETSDTAYRDVLKRMPFYASAIATGLPFPKTRRVVYLENTPAALPGWIHLEWIGS
ncbi:type III-A CRISPR-associated RAMP protein Csm5 [Bryobacter aggregatus]|uniref:type III-A CRISPR-associated RAMP protein Csm5 n=1 Tax=Bryobacter aggregatus TaxID=360054 RepID=UPI0004E17AA6|nr:type III-A CRISPR-associated RAMP protein Csm5 [Bryobacter aggregatus]